MPTWKETQEYIRSRYRLVKDEEDWIGMEWGSSVDGRWMTQRLKIERISAFAQPWLLIRSALCAEDKIEARSALLYNARLSVGSIALENGRCYLRAAMPLDNLTWPHLDEAIELVASEAAKLCHNSHDGAPDDSLFSGFVD
jgi:hypothetical protein